MPEVCVHVGKVKHLVLNNVVLNTVRKDYGSPLYETSLYSS